MLQHLVILISGRGSNMEAILNAIDAGTIRTRKTTVVSSCKNTPGLKTARARKARTKLVDRASFQSRAAFNRALLTQLKQETPDLIALAGFMHILDAEFVRCFEGKILNVHPALLPEHKGLHTHQRVIEAGGKRHGCSVHFVTEKLDSGPVVMQAEIEVDTEDTPDSLAARVLKYEHLIYPKTIALYCEGRLRMKENCCTLDREPLQKPLLFEENRSAKEKSTVRLP